MLETRSSTPFYIILLLVAVPGIVAQFSGAGSFPLQAPTTVVAVAPSLASMSVGDTADMRVEIEDPVNLYAFDITLAFEASVIQINDADPDEPGVQVRLGPLLDEHQHFVATNYVDNEAGTIHFAASLLAPEEPINTSGELITLTIRGESNGTSPLVLSEVQLVNPNASTLPTDLVDATIIVGAATTTPTTTSTPTPPSPTPTPVPSNHTELLPLILHNYHPGPDHLTNDCTGAKTETECRSSSGER